MKVVIQGWIVCHKYTWSNNEPKFDFYSFKPEESEDLTILREETIEFEVPDDYDPTAAKIAALHKMKEKARQKLAKELQSIEDKISKLLALPNEVK